MKKIRDDPTEMMRDGLMSIDQAALFLGRSYSWMTKQLRYGEIPYVRLGADRLIPRRWLLEYAASKLVEMK